MMNNISILGRKWLKRAIVALFAVALLAAAATSAEAVINGSVNPASPTADRSKNLTVEIAIAPSGGPQTIWGMDVYVLYDTNVFDVPTITDHNLGTGWALEQLDPNFGPGRVKFSKASLSGPGYTCSSQANLYRLVFPVKASAPLGATTIQIDTATNPYYIMNDSWGDITGSTTVGNVTITEDTTDPEITTTTPADGATDVSTTANVVVNFSEAMNTSTVTYNSTPNPGGWSVVWSNGNTRATYSHSNAFADSTEYTFEITAGEDVVGNSLVAGAVPNPFSFTTGSDVPPGDPDITLITPATAEVGQTLVIDGANFGATQGTSVVRFGTTMGNPTSWSDDQIIVAVPSDPTLTGDVVVTVDVDGTTDTENITIAGEKIYVDDFEGGAVNCFTPTVDSLYYVFEDVEDMTPVDADINDDLRSTEEAYEREYGAKVRYSFVGTDGSDWGGGWGAKLANALDLDATYAIDVFIKWDGTSNYITLNFKDGDGTANATDISNAVLLALGSEGGVVRLYKSNFDVDETGSDAGDDGSFDWTDVAGYNLVYKGEATTAEYHYLDALSAVLGTTGGPEINTIIPAAGPAGTQITVSGIGFGDNQSMSMLMFENTDTGASYQAEIISWREDQIVAIVPRLADKGAYEVRVIKIAIVAGATTAQESNPADFTVTARGATEGGLATIYPNPFNPIAEQTGQPNASAIKAVTIAYDPGSASHVGVYIYDMTARLVYKQVTSDTQVTWDGYDTHSNLVGDGAYILRIVDEDSKRVIAKGKILVIKQ